jgi:hypothetical protein
VLAGDNTDSIKDCEARLVLKEGVTPIFHKAYPFPYTAKKQVGKQINEMVTEGHLIPMHHSEWASLKLAY